MFQIFLFYYQSSSICIQKKLTVIRISLIGLISIWFLLNLFSFYNTRLKKQNIKILIIENKDGNSSCTTNKR